MAKKAVFRYKIACFLCERNRKYKKVGKNTKLPFSNVIWCRIDPKKLLRYHPMVFLTTFLNHGFSISLYIPIQTRKWHFQDPWQNDKKSRMQKIQNLRCPIPKTRYIGHVKNPHLKKSIEPAYSPPPGTGLQPTRHRAEF